ncbi:JMJD7-PLA2G4B protein [Thecamonas trahens ATCC 50062]|uniref:JMJD7-PLA2G4B protein n=1 Tax=Thecamonas trahens ATCC 50062 TaxID=461836 RepID=A0A0L0DXY9_THETB|nr:JMJD7-PLA2G4B protein [Thecamonas trahens ATCC 50062]KNC56398.1 JMJD7-PLA2G4B protein [Thecamonas trahens ATCC 50062]|eukprot:XP_013760912.1 JMJD7-PLA2G4B protein [Thecamonas trahens ATCC 50062]
MSSSPPSDPLPQPASWGADYPPGIAPRSEARRFAAARAALKVQKAAVAEFERRHGPIPRKVKVISPPSASTFMRKYVAHNRPVIIRGAAEHWPARAKWDLDYLDDAIGKRKINVNVMPYSAGSGTIVGGHHVDPKLVTMRVTDLISLLHSEADSAKSKSKSKAKAQKKSKRKTAKASKIKAQKNRKKSAKASKTNGHANSALPDKYYVSSNENNFTKQFPELKGDVDMRGFGFFPAAIDSVNLWMGGEGCFSPLHNDYMDNLYLVVRGQKSFRLYSPLSSIFLYEARFRKAFFDKSPDGEWFIDEVAPIKHQNWIAVDPLSPDYARHPLFKYAAPIDVTLEEGDMLFLPTHWYHQVSQSVDAEGKCIALNYWFKHDVPYDYVDLFNATESAAQAILGERFLYDGPSSSSSDTAAASSSTDSATDSLDSETTFDPLHDI